MRKLAIVLALLLVALPAAAQTAKPKLAIPLPYDPLGLNGSTGTVPTAGGLIPGLDLKVVWAGIVSSTQADMIYAKAMADNVGSPGSKLRSQCYAALITANEQANGTTLKDAAGNPLPRPDPAIITGVEQAAELVDNLSATAPLTAACAPAANALQQNVLQFIAALVTGTAAKAFLP
jgi:hypothetical protein